MEVKKKKEEVLRKKRKAEAEIVRSWYGSWSGDFRLTRRWRSFGSEPNLENELWNETRILKLWWNWRKWNVNSGKALREFWTLPFYRSRRACLDLDPLYWRRKSFFWEKNELLRIRTRERKDDCYDHEPPSYEDSFCQGFQFLIYITL